MSKKRIRVMHLVETLGVGGMENGVVNIANHIDLTKFELAICCFDKSGQLAGRITKKEIKIHELKYGPGIHLKSIIRIAKLLQKEKVEILHTHGWGARSFVGLLAAKIAGTKRCINGEHGVLHIEKRIQIIIQKTMNKFFDGTLSVSNSLKEKLIENLGLKTEEVCVIPNGVDAKRFHGKYSTEKLKNEFNLGKNDFVIGIIASLKQQKNQKIVLQAVQELKDKKKIIKLLLAGDGPDKNRLRLLVNKLALNDEVVFLGNRDDIPELLTAMDLMILPSVPDHEGMSNVILEGMASGVPVISSRSIGANELIENKKNGILFNYKDVDELKVKILEIMENDRLREDIIVNARNKIFREHTLDCMVGKYEKYYKKIINEV